MANSCKRRVDIRTSGRTAVRVDALPRFGWVGWDISSAGSRTADAIDKQIQPRCHSIAVLRTAEDEPGPPSTITTGTRMLFCAKTYASSRILKKIAVPVTRDTGFAEDSACAGSVHL